MESLLTGPSERFDCGVIMDRFLNAAYTPTLPANLPVLGSNLNLDQILSSSSLDSPDSSSAWTTSGVESGSSDDGLDNLPDSTTMNVERGDDTMSVGSDPLNSSGSEYSFAASPPPSFEFDYVDLLTSSADVTENNNNNNSAAGGGSLKRRIPEPTTEEEEAARPKKRTRKSKVGPTDLSCPLCDYSTRVKEHLASHMNSHTTDRKYMCLQCGQTFKWSHSLRRHQRTHSKEYKYACAFCPKSFSRKDHLAVHEKLHDSENAEAFPCAECGVTFKNKKTLTGHMKTHSADKPYKCTACESEFTRKASLTRHVLAAHAGQVFHCDICSAPFSYKSTLEDHRRAVHNEGKRDFHCLACGLSFACKAYLQKHMGVCKNRPDRVDLPCPDCGDVFSSRRHLQDHRRRDHKKPAAAAAPHNIGHAVSQWPRPTPLPSFNSQPAAAATAAFYPAPPQARQQYLPRCCEVCHAFFDTEAALETHFMTHVPPQPPQGASLEPLLAAPQHQPNLAMPFETEPIEENFGSILRQVYDSEHSDFGQKNVGPSDQQYFPHMTMLYDLL